MSKSLTVKDLAAKYGVSANLIAAELVRQGVKVDKAEKTKIPDDMTDLIESFFDDLYGQQDEEALLPKGGKRSGAPKKGNSRREEMVPKDSHRKNSDSKGEQEKSVGDSGNTITLSSPIVVKTLADAIGRKPNEVLTDLIKLGELSGINKTVSDANARKICEAAGFELVIGAAPKAAAPEPVTLREREVDESKLVPRPPVVTFMGHVDHGKTSLQDAIRHTNVTAGEAGAITQHIGASTVEFEGKHITFIDTPGHAAFTSMRARGANITDIVVLAVSAVEGFKPQTVEAMNHALAADVPIIVAANKMDLPGADYDQVLLHMQQNNLTSEDWGGKVGVVKVSAKTKEGLPDLLERILVEADMLELKADPTGPAEGVVLEAQLEQAENVLIAVKPQVIASALEDYKYLLKNKTIFSIAAGISIETLEELTSSKRIIRIMPNTPALVGFGAAAYSASEGAEKADIELAGKIFSAVGVAFQVPESALDAVTAVSGSGPAYVFEFIQAMADGGVAEGLSREMAVKLAAQTVLGAAQMVLKTSAHPQQLKDNVTSPAGTTSRALELMAERGFSGIVMQSVRAAAKRSRELGGVK